MSSARSKFSWDNGTPIVAFLAQEEPLGPSIEFSNDSLVWPAIDCFMRILIRVSGVDGSHDRAKRKLRRGHLIVSGYRDAPTKSPAPVEIARQHILSGKICWLSETLTHDSFKYSKLRVTSKAALKRMEGFNKIGQRPHKQAIDAEIRSLLSEPDFCGMLRKQQVGALKEKLLSKGIKLNISDKSLARSIFQIESRNI